MYYIIDLATDARYACGTKIDVIWRYARLAEYSPFRHVVSPAMHFDNLNVTGRDTRIERVRAGYRYVDDIPIPVYTESVWLRRYQVVDDAGRSIDIRAWKAEIAAIEAGDYYPHVKRHEHVPIFRREPCVSGRKQRSHRIGLPAMWKASLQDTLDNENDDLAEYVAIRDHTKPRNRGISIGDGWDVYGRRLYAISHTSKCWKDQSKSGRQWAKHKRGCTKRALREAGGSDAFDEEMYYEEMLMQELYVSWCTEDEWTE